MDMTISGLATLGHSRSGSKGNEWVLRIPQSSSITGASASYFFVSYLGHSLEMGGVLPLYKDAVYSTAPVDWGVGLISFMNSTFLDE